MKIPTLQEVVGFQYSQLVHLVLLLVLLAECLAHTIIAAIDEYHKFYYALGIIVPVLAGLFWCIRMQPFAEQFEWFPGGSVLVELVAYVIHVVLNAVALGFLCDYLSNLAALEKVELLHENPLNDNFNILPAAPVNNLSSIQTARRNAVLLIVCLALELVLEALLVYKLLPALVHLWRGSPAQKDSTLHELKCKDGCACVGASANEHVELAEVSA